MHLKILLYILLFNLMIFLNACGTDTIEDNDPEPSASPQATISSEPNVSPQPGTSPEPSASPQVTEVPDDNQFTMEEKLFVYSLFKSEYLWHRRVLPPSSVDFTSITSPQEMINTLRVTPPDKWSFTITPQEWEDFSNQKTAGFGFAYTSNFKIFLVRIDAPAYGKLFRGDKILQINGQAVTSSNIALASQNVNTLTSFTVLRNNREKKIDIASSEYNFKVSLGKVIDHNSQKIGYLRYDSFTGTSVEELESIFTTFKTADISELIIDLRYNSGGSIGVASILLDNISNAYPDQRQVYLDWNAEQKNNNTEYHFESSDLQDGNELNMQRVIFLITKNSSSASELIISALKPYLGEENVITIGTNTGGKPVGMAGRVYEKNYYFLINFIVRNNASEASSFDGISPTCSTYDDITRIMGDENENMLSVALYYIDYDSCPQEALSIFK